MRLQFGQVVQGSAQISGCHDKVTGAFQRIAHGRAHLWIRFQDKNGTIAQCQVFHKDLSGVFWPPLFILHVWHWSELFVNCFVGDVKRLAVVAPSSCPAICGRPIIRCLLVTDQ